MPALHHPYPATAGCREAHRQLLRFGHFSLAREAGAAAVAVPAQLQVRRETGRVLLATTAPRHRDGAADSQGLRGADAGPQLPGDRSAATTSTCHGDS